MKSSGRYIDLLLKNHTKYVIVEIKCTFISNTSVVTDQILEYKKTFSEESGIPNERIICCLVSPKGFSNEVLSLCENHGVITKIVDENEIINSAPKNKLKFNNLDRNNKCHQILMIRNKNISDHSNDNFNNINKEINSVKKWVNAGFHDKLARKNIAQIFSEISEKAPIRAHEVDRNSNGKLIDNYDMWFWLFYSVMDRRSNAANFINAKEALEKKDIFEPQKIIKLINEKDERTAIFKIERILKSSGFPLMRDSSMGDLAFPRSIVEAAELISKYDYDFEKYYKHHLDKSNSDPYLAYNTIRKEIEGIYGVGPRISSQFIRGMVLKSNWNLPLTDDKLLEKCKFNIRFASKARLGLIEEESNYHLELGKLAEDFLDGNRAIISHALWYIRKRYCDQKIMCDECKLSGYCNYFLKTIQHEPLKEDLSLYIS